MTRDRWSGRPRHGAGLEFRRRRHRYPGVVWHGRPLIEPHHLGRGWVGFDYAAAFGKPVRMLNDAAMQAVGSYEVAGCCSSDWNGAWFGTDSGWRT